MVIRRLGIQLCQAPPPIARPFDDGTSFLRGS
jgi:hypothetical protein